MMNKAASSWNRSMALISPFLVFVELAIGYPRQAIPRSLREAATVAAHGREFSAHLIMGMGVEKERLDVPVYIKQDQLYMNFPGPENKPRVPFWFLSNGTVDSVKAVNGPDFNPGPLNPILAGFLLLFRPTSAENFCKEFRSYYLAMMNATGARLSDATMKSLEDSRHFPCERTGHEFFAQRDCVIYRFSAMTEYWTLIDFDPKLEVILQVQYNPPQGLILRLANIKEGPQRDSLFVPPPGRLVFVTLTKP
jgi:hypothetical protein